MNNRVTSEASWTPSQMKSSHLIWPRTIDLKGRMLNDPLREANIEIICIDIEMICRLIWPDHTAFCETVQRSLAIDDCMEDWSE